MKLLEIKALTIEAVKVVRFGRFVDARGYFTEHYRRSDFDGHPEMSFMQGIRFVQCNESYSRKSVIRGLHFQWNPHMGKLVRTLSGRMIDMVLDIRRGSPTAGKIICYDMPAVRGAPDQEWIWVPPGFAHGNFFTEDTCIEYLCSGEYSSDSEAGISPLAADIDWSLCLPELKQLFVGIVSGTAIISPKDEQGLSFHAWINDPRAENFVFGGR